jgi:hypothetical protein
MAVVERGRPARATLALARPWGYNLRRLQQQRLRRRRWHQPRNAVGQSREGGEPEFCSGEGAIAKSLVKTPRVQF